MGGKTLGLMLKILRSKAKFLGKKRKSLAFLKGFSFINKTTYISQNHHFL
jgi:hypothetical protein